MKSKRILSTLLAVVMIVGMLPISTLTTFAADGDTFTVDGFTYRVTDEFNREVSLIDATNAVGDCVIPQSVNGYNVSVVEAMAFYECTGLTGITLPDTVYSIGTSAFAYCSNLKSVKFPDDLYHIGPNAFFKCTKLAEINLPNGLNRIDQYAFSYCSALKTVNIPSSVSSIGACAFEYCTELTEITIPEGVRELGNAVFYDCAKLTHITIPGSVTNIGAQMFSGCSSLETVLIMEGQPKTIHDAAFQQVDGEPISATVTYQYVTPSNLRWEDRTLKWDGVNSGYVRYKIDISWEMDSGINPIRPKAFYVTDSFCDLSEYVGQKGTYNVEVTAVLPEIIDNSKPRYQDSGTASIETKYPFQVEISNVQATRVDRYTGKVSFTTSMAGTMYYFLSEMRYNQAPSVDTSGEGTAVRKGKYEFSLPVKDGINPQLPQYLYLTFKTADGVVSDVQCIEIPGMDEYYYTVNATASEGGSISPAIEYVKEGDSLTLTITPNEGYELATLTVDGVNVTDAVVGNQYTVSGIEKEKTVAVTAAFRLIPHPHTHCICGGNTAVGDHTAHSDVNFTYWYDNNALPTDAGNYVLMNDVTISSAWYPADGTVLCLNGNDIKVDDNTDSRVIYIDSHRSFVLCDCSEQPGKITGGHDNDWGGGIHIEINATLTMYNGQITGNSAGAGAGVYSSGIFNMYGGKIYGNTADSYGGGVYHDGNTAYRAMAISGNATITDNFLNNGTDSNLHVGTRSGEIGKVTISDDFSGNVGISMYEYGVFSTGGADYAQYFAADNADYVVTADGNNLKLIEKIIPTIAFASGYNPSKIYDGQPIPNPTEGDLEIVDAEYSDVVFTWTAKEGSSLTDGKPVNAGGYALTATIPATDDRKEASVQKDHRINKAWVDDTIYNQKVENTSLVEQRISLPALSDGASYVFSKLYLGSEVEISDHFTKLEIDGTDLVYSGKDSMTVGDIYDVLIAVVGENHTGTIEIEMRVVAHTHNYTYSANGAVITESCSCGHNETATVKVPTGELDYFGEEYQSWITYSSGWAGNRDYELSYLKDGDIPEYLDGAGTYTVSLTIEGETATASYTIHKAPNAITNLEDVSKIYDGKAVKKPKFSRTTFSIGDVSYDYKPYGADDSEYTNQAPKNAGKYTCRITMAEDKNYEEAVATVDFEISKAPLTVTANNHQITYGEAPTNDGVSYSGFVNSETESVLDGTLDYDYNYVQYGNVGNAYTITPKGLTSNNYNISYVNGTLIVTEKEIGIDWTQPANLVYDGNAKVPTATATGLVNGDSVNITVALTDSNDNVNVGSFTYTATAIDNTNYRLPSNVTSDSYTITQATPTITNPTASRVRRGNALSTSTFTGGAAKGVDGTTDITGIFTWKDGTEVLNTNGTEQKTVVFTPDSTFTNYKACEFDIDVEVYSSSGSSSGTTRYTVKFETNGGTEISSKTVTRNSKLTAPDEPTKENHLFEGWYTDEELTEKYNFDSKVAKSFTLYARWGEVVNDPDIDNELKWNPFIDVKESDWFHDVVKEAYLKGLIKGISGNTFSPNGDITRGMFVTILYRAEGESAVNKSIPFADVKTDDYFANAVIWAQQNGIVKGISENEFAPNASITREQMAAILYRYAQFKEYDVSIGEDTNILSYADFDKISEYAIPAMQWACGDKIISGKGDGVLDPLGTATRAEAAAVLVRFLEKI